MRGNMALSAFLYCNKRCNFSVMKKYPLITSMLLLLSHMRAHVKHADGMDWRNIQNRVEFLKGRVDIQSSSSKGTSVMIEINS